MKNAIVRIVSTVAGIFAILLGTNGNVYGDEPYLHEKITTDYTIRVPKVDIQQYFGEHQLSSQLKVYIHFDKDPSYYHDGLIITNGTETKIDIGELAQKYVSPFWIKLNYYGNDHPENEVCLKNLDSNKKNCEDVNSDDTKIDIDMPD